MTPENVHQHVCEAHNHFLREQHAGLRPQNWNQLRAELVEWVKGLDSTTAFHGLMSLLATEREYAYQDIAGELLDKGNVPCPLGIEEFLRIVLPMWDLSARTVPLYAAKIFGRDAVLQHVSALESACVDWPGRGSLNGFKYQLGDYPDT